MFENLTPLSNQQLLALMMNRVRYGEVPSDLFIHDKVLLDPFALMDILYHANNQVRVGGLSFKHCIFKKPVNIGEHQRAGYIVFEDCIFESETNFATTDNITLQGYIEFKGDTTILVGNKGKLENIVVRRMLSITSEGFLRGDFFVNNVNVDIPSPECTISVRTSSVKIMIENIHSKELRVLHTSGRIISIKDSKIYYLVLTGNDNAELHISTTEIEEIDLFGLSKPETVINFFDNKFANLAIGGFPFKRFNLSHSAIGQLILSGLIEKDTYITILKVQLRELFFEDLYNNGIISMRQLAIGQGGTLSMVASTLGKTDFILCQFGSGKFEFENSKITDVFLAETDFPRTVFLNGTHNYAQAQLAFGQISTAFQKQGDTVRALEYQSREIEAHYRNLDYWNKTARKISFTKISLGLNKLSNDFGRSWQRAILFSVIAGIIFFYLLVISSKEYFIGWPVSFDKRLFPAFLKFMNPLRFFDSELLFKSNEGDSFLTLIPISYLFDYLGRIFVAYGFYQIIQAFRKFGRKT